MADLHGTAAKHIGGPHHHRIADLMRLLLGQFGRGGGGVGRLLEVEGLQQHLESLAVLGQVDGVGRGAENRDIGLFQRCRQLQRRLAAELDDDAQNLALALLDANQLDDGFGGQRLEIQAVRGVVVGRYGFRVAVDHDGLLPGLVQGIRRMDAAIVELDALADAVGPAAQDDHLLALGRVGFALGRADAVALVAGIHVGRARGEFAGAGVDALEHRADVEDLAAERHLGRCLARQFG